MPPTTTYSDEDVVKAVTDVLSNKSKIPGAAKVYGTPERSLRWHVANARTSSPPTNSMGPSPMLPRQYERDLVSWILAMQQEGNPATRANIITRAKEMMRVVHGYEHPQPTTGWYQKFLRRHAELKTTKSQFLSKTRYSVDRETVVTFYHELVHALSYVDFDPRRVFNMDEMSFSSTKTAKKVVVHRSTKQVYVDEVKASSHLTIVCLRWCRWIQVATAIHSAW
ncbi:Aste57867_9748 [Aphanomyces stellatus]|uniref:Aste57867_9748 protein n=1 Tax=Aphanomyces stellatus TaxID=120398 RepID=A0A485KNQ3_9STRA|nr:hypothetical protein As57867_009709 [Aphanomyces stellatus]VFT86627.1 Aste57867_9748 [Aphanomyces stellatus]